MVETGLLTFTVTMTAYIVGSVTVRTPVMGEYSRCRFPPPVVAADTAFAPVAVSALKSEYVYMLIVIKRYHRAVFIIGPIDQLFRL